MNNATPLVLRLLDHHYLFEPVDSGAYYVQPHIHPFHQMDIFLSGRVKVTVGNQKPYIAKAGDGVLVPPLTSHSYHSPKGALHATFKFLMQPRYWARFGRQIRRMHLDDSYRDLIRLAGERYVAKQPLAEQEATAVASICLVQCLHQSGIAEDTSQLSDSWQNALWSVLQQVNDRPFEDWTVAELAESCEVCEDHFSRQFQRLLGQRPQRYLLEVRMNAAAGMLLDDPMHPIKSVAEQAGYATVHAFSRAFANVWGVPPAAYRKSRWEM